MTNEKTLQVTDQRDQLKRLGAKSFQDLKDQLNNTIKRIGEDYLWLSRIVYHIKTDNLFRGMGYRSWEDFCDKLLRMSARKANYFVMMWEKIKDLPNDAVNDFGKIPWTNAREITRVIDGNNYGRWIEAAQTIPHDKLVEKVREERDEQILKAEAVRGERTVEGDLPAEKADDDEKLYPMHFSFYRDQYENVRNALKKASKMSHSSKPSNNLSLIAMDFLATQGHVDSIPDLLGFFEEALSLEIVAVDSKTRKTVYGEQYLEEPA